MLDNTPYESTTWTWTPLILIKNQPPQPTVSFSWEPEMTALVIFAFLGLCALGNRASRRKVASA